MDLRKSLAEAKAIYLEYGKFFAFVCRPLAVDSCKRCRDRAHSLSQPLVASIASSLSSVSWKAWTPSEHCVCQGQTL